MTKFIFPITRLENIKKVNPELADSLYSIGIMINNSLEVNREDYLNLKNKKTIQAKEPGITQKASTLGKSLIEWAGNKFARVDKEIYNKRLSICRECEHWVENGNAGFGKCNKCGCGRGKLWLHHEQCPIELWAKEPLT
jgi:hypothetical protein